LGQVRRHPNVGSLEEGGLPRGQATLNVAGLVTSSTAPLISDRRPGGHL